MVTCQKAYIEPQKHKPHCDEEIFAAEDETDWEEWIEFFSRTREMTDRRKGLVEIEL